MYNKILVPIDLEQASSVDKALPVAVAMCQAFGAELVLMTVVPEFGMAIVSSYFPEGYETKMRDDAAKVLAKIANDALPQGLSAKLEVGHGTIYPVVAGSTPAGRTIFSTGYGRRRRQMEPMTENLSRFLSQYPAHGEPRNIYSRGHLSSH